MSSSVTIIKVEVDVQTFINNPSRSLADRAAKLGELEQSSMRCRVGRRMASSINPNHSRASQHAFSESPSDASPKADQGIAA